MLEKMTTKGNDVLLYDASTAIKKGEGSKAYIELQKCIDERPPLMKELNTYRKYVPIMLQMAKEQQMLNNEWSKLFDRYEAEAMQNHYKRWSPEEDATLIEMVCGDDCTMWSLASTFGRTPSSIKARLTTLVGLKRVSQEVAGRFIGTVDGVKTDSIISGTIYKEGK